MRGLAVMRAPECASRSFVSDSRLASAVHREAREEALERTLPNLAEDFSRFSYNIVWPCTRRMWLMRLTESKFCLWVLAKLNAFVHCLNDIRLGQELIRDVLSRSDSNSNCCANPR